MVDFIFFYEHKQRELESVVLLKTELERRGYTVALYGAYEKNRLEVLPLKKLKPKVAVLSALYTPSVLSYFSTSLIGFNRKIANLQWEQILFHCEEINPECKQNVFGFVQNAMHFCWGEKSRKRIVDNGVPADKAITTGYINLDLLKPAFRSFLMSRDALAEKYHLDSGKKWALFVSSFSMANADPQTVHSVEEVLGKENTEKYINISRKSKEILLEWFESVVRDNPETILIYRPHPDEIGPSSYQSLRVLEDRYANFRVINEQAIKHWIVNSNIVYNWMSTSMIDILQLNPAWHLLRPVPFDSEMDIDYMHAMPQITELEEFRDSFNDPGYRSEAERQFSPAAVYEYYDNLDPNRFAYMKVADCLEELYRSDKYDLRYPLSYKVSFVLHTIKNRLGVFSYQHQKLFRPLARAFRHHWKNLDEEIAYLEQGYQRNVATPEEIEELSAKIRDILANG